MKVRVEFEGETLEGFSPTHGVDKQIEINTLDSDGKPISYSVPKSWCTPVSVDEPDVYGPYLLRNEDGIFYAYKVRYSNYWVLFGSTSNYLWEEFGNVIEVERLETDEG